MPGKLLKGLASSRIRDLTGPFRDRGGCLFAVASASARRSLFALWLDLRLDPFHLLPA